MILGTYQPKELNLDSVYISLLKDIIGFEPIFCFASDTLINATIGSLLVSPSFPETFCLIDTTNFIKIDMIKWHKILYLVNNKMNVTKDMIEDCLFCENNNIHYLISVETFNKNKKISFNLVDMIYNRNYIYIPPKCDYTKEDARRLLYEEYSELLDTNKHTALKLFKFRFVIFGLPLFYEEMNVYFNSKLYIQLGIDKQICLFVQNFGSQEYKNDNFIDDIKRKIIQCFKPYSYNIKIYPNDSCPCNSGKKYKKCCEKYFKLMH